MKRTWLLFALFVLLALSIGCVDTTTPPPMTPLVTKIPVATTPSPTLSTGNCTNISVGPNLFDRGNGLIYDADRDITWLQDADYAQTSGYDIAGKMNRDDAMTGADTLGYSGVD